MGGGVRDYVWNYKKEENLSFEGNQAGGQSQVRIHTGFYRFTAIGHIFHNRYTLNNKNTFQVETWPISCMNDSET